MHPSDMHPFRYKGDTLIVDEEKGQLPEEIDARIEKQKTALVEKYGRAILNRLHSIVFQEVSAEGTRRAEKAE